MKKVYCLLFVFILMTTLFFTTAQAERFETPSAEKYNNGYRYNVQGWIYTHIEGDPYERGFQHGYLLADEIVDMINRWSKTIHNHALIKPISKRVSESNYHKMSMTWWNFCTSRIYKLYWDKFPEEYQQEIEGITDGVNAKGAKVHGRAVNFKDILGMNEMYEFMSKLTTLRMGSRPFRVLLHQLQRVEPAADSISLADFIKSILDAEPAHHCNGFIATGDATTDGQIVFSQSCIAGGSTWWWNHYISLRWNVLLDVQPSEGNRFTISTSPGLIWSDMDYYQNENGIMLLETTVPQGFFDRIGLPLSVRARNAIQYGNSIDDVVYYLRHKNDGSMNAVWLIGDTKTGEIARFELGYSNYAIYRTFNGFHWSANNPFDLRVRAERFKISLAYVGGLLLWILKGNRGLAFSSIRYIPGGKDLKYEELGNKYYGKIDVDIVKEIMFTRPIPGSITDCKITDSKLIEKNGLWAYTGNPTKPLDYTNVDSQEWETVSVDPNGWVRMFGVPEKNDFELKKEDNDYGEEAEATWKFDTEFNVNEFSSSFTAKDNILYTTTSEGKLFAVDAEYGYEDWNQFVGFNPTAPLIKNDLIYVGHEKGVTALKMNGRGKWETAIDDTVTSIVLVGDKIIFGDDVGNAYAHSAKDGSEKWTLDLSKAEVHISKKYDDNLYITSGENCYAINLDNQKIKWNYTIDGMITSAPLVKNGKVYFGSWNNYVYALDAEKGTLIWDYETGWGIDNTPSVFNDVLYVGSTDNNLYALNANTGNLKWIFSCNAAIHSNPVVYGEFVIFGSDDGRLYAVEKDTGESGWFFAPDLTIDKDVYNYIVTPIVSDSIVDNGFVYTSANGTIYALDTQTVEEVEARVNDKDEIPQETLMFIVISLAVVILLTAVYLVLSKKRFK